MKKFARLHFTRQNTNLPLLIFLIFFLNVKFVIKILAILFILFYYRNFKWGLSWRQSRLPLFYILIALLEIIKYIFITRNYSLDYGLVFCLGIMQWGFCLLAIHHIKLAIELNTAATIHNTIRAFYLLNFMVSVFFLIILLFHPAWLTYWGQGKDISFSHPSAGDAIIGISFDNSTVNATINALGLIYFLYKKDYLLSIVCLVIIVICTSNASFLFITATLLLMILTVRSNKLRLNTILAALTLVILYFSSSATNRKYVHNYFVQLYILNKNPELFSASHVDDSVYAIDKTKLKRSFGHLLNLHNHSQVIVTPFGKRTYLYVSNTDFNSKPGKLISFFQTYVYLRSDIGHLIFGAGIGNFSSKLAFRASGVNILGTYPKRYIYSSFDFEYNHLRTFNHYINGPPSQHSVMNFPFSVYNQLLGEYGLIGALLFVIYYVGFFVWRQRILSYGKYMLLILLGFFFMEYWFEFFSLVVIFELFMLLDISEEKITRHNVRTNSPSP
jgi:hypothetical protein